MRRRLLGALSLCGLWLAACSADAVEEAPPTLETAGVFVARADPEGGYRLFRVLQVLRVDPTQRTLFLTVYALRTASIDEAREAAQHESPPIAVPVQIHSAQQFASAPHAIVWFRSLTPEERQRVR